MYIGVSLGDAWSFRIDQSDNLLLLAGFPPSYLASCHLTGLLLKDQFSNFQLTILGEQIC